MIRELLEGSADNRVVGRSRAPLYPAPRKSLRRLWLPPSFCQLVYLCPNRKRGKNNHQDEINVHDTLTWQAQAITVS